MTSRSLACLAAFYLAFQAPDADACSMAGPGFYPNAGPSEVPVDGAWTIGASCFDCDSEIPQLSVTDSGGDEVPGSVTVTMPNGVGYLTWLPDAPLTLDETYTVTFSGEHLLPDQEPATFTAVASRGSTVPELAPQVTQHESWEFEGEGVCCTIDSCDEQRCQVAPTGAATRTATVMLDFSPLEPDAESDEFLRQFLFRRVVTDGAEQQVTDWTTTPSFSLPFVGDDRLVCFTITARHVASGEESLFYDDCIDLANGPHSTEEENREQAFEGLRECLDANEEATLQCDVYAEALRADSCDGYELDACALALEECDSATDGGVDGAAPTARGGDGASGCSVGRSPAGQRSAAPVLGGLLLLLGAALRLGRPRSLGRR